MNDRKTDETVETEISPAASDVSPRLQLRVLSAPHAQTVPLPARGELGVGRSNEADLRIDDTSISRRHATLRIDRGVRLEDLGSANGTRVRNARVDPASPVDLRSGDMIEFGRVLCVLVGTVPDAKTTAPPPAEDRGQTPVSLPGDIIIEEPAMVRLHQLVD